MNIRNVVIRSGLVLVLSMSVFYASYLYLPLLAPKSRIRDKKRLLKHQNFHSKYLPPRYKENCTQSLQILDSKWLQVLHSVDGFWTVQNMVISKASMKWWQYLQGSKSEDVNTILKALYTEGVPEEGLKFNHGNRTCVRCAVVGNSGNLKGSKYSNKIDTNDIVIRFNGAPTQGFRKDVGFKTTHHIMYPESAKALPVGTNFVLVPFKPLDVKWLLSALTTGNITKTYQNVQRRISSKPKEVAILNPEFIRQIHSHWLRQHGRYPSSGMIGIALALQKCDKVELFGFGADKEGSWHHYWQKLPKSYAAAFRKTKVHDADEEKRMIDQLEKDGLVTVFRGIS